MIQPKRALGKLELKLREINPSACASLQEGQEETLSLHRLGLYAELGRSFSSTNCIESVMSQVGQYTDKVDRWRGGSHIQRWAAAGLLELESRLPKMKRFRYLKLLRMKLQEEVAKRHRKTRLRETLQTTISRRVYISLSRKIDGRNIRRAKSISTKICIDSKRTRLRNENIQYFDIADFSMSNSRRRKGWSPVNPVMCMQLDRGLGCAEFGPRKMDKHKSMVVASKA